MTEIIIEAKSLLQIFGQTTSNKLSNKQKFTALANVNLAIQKGSTAIILGPSGSGKSTLFNILATQSIPTAGKLRIHYSEPITLTHSNLLKFRWTTIGYMQQRLDSNFVSRFSLKQLLQFMREMDSNLKIEIHKLKEYLIELGMDERHLNIPIQKLSGGEQQRISLLLLLIRDPTIYLLDEPTSFLDDKNKKRIIKILNRLKNQNKTLIISTHDGELLSLADKVYFLENGQIKGNSQSIESIAESLWSQNFRVKGTQASKEYNLVIPAIVFQLLPPQIPYILITEEKKNKRREQDNPLKFSFSQANKSAFDNAVKNTETLENWIFLDSNTFKIPTNCQSPHWLNRKILWIFTKTGIQIHLHEKK